MSARFYGTVRALSAPFLHAWIRLAIDGAGNVPPRGPLLMVANHASYLDPAVLGRASPRMIHFLVKRPVWNVRGLNWFFRGMSSIPVSSEGSDSSALRAALRLLADGRVIGIFPEGGRSPDGTPRPAKVGAALLAARSGCPVLPVAIRGAHAAMPVGAMLPRPRRVEVVFGRPFTVDGGGGRGARARLDAISERMMREIGSLLTPAGDGGAAEARA